MGKNKATQAAIDLARQMAEVDCSALMRIARALVSDRDLLERAFAALDELTTRWEKDGRMSTILNDPILSPLVSARDHLLSALHDRKWD